VRGSLDVIVVGAGIGGLGSALALSRAGHTVTIVERDDTAMPEDVEGAFDWDRRGAPQTRHPHAFLGLARTILRDRFPDVLDALAAAGVHDIPMGAELPIRLDETVRAVLTADDDLRLLACRRTTFEWVLRRCVLTEPNVTLRVGRGVSGLVAADTPSGPVPLIVGVELDDGSTLDADLVVVSSGRRGAVSEWLGALSVDLPETTTDAGVVYFSRFYRSGRDERFGFRGGFGAGLIAGVIGADAGTYSITAVVDQHDRQLRAHLSVSDRFDATMRLLPELADVAAVDGVPIHPVHCMTGLVNRRRQFTHSDGNPRVTGMLACGDVHTCTNPAHGRGMSLALRQATLIVDAIAAADDLTDVGRRYEADCTAQVEPWYQFSLLTDQMRSMASDTVTGRAPRAGAGSGLNLFEMLTGAGADTELMRSALRVVNLLDLPHTLLARLPEIQTRLAATPTPRPARTGRRRPTRAELLAVIG
jgi:2-polyprenyl-6-methoxyphenol hydroxylase-like FAD-dependent oxidoreductase